jgi:hypothetical protein
MKIIKDGRNRTYQEECRKCGTIYEYSERDYFEITEEKPSGLAEIREHLFKANETYRQICRYKWKCLRCPVCGDLKKRMDADRLFKPEEVRWERVE